MPTSTAKFGHLIANPADMHFCATYIHYYFSYRHAEKSENIKSELTKQLISYQLSKIINKFQKFQAKVTKK